MTESDTSTYGYLYVLSVKDIDLPVCKIGMTSRDPDIRCAEINDSATGDFLWEVVHRLLVNDCRKLESLVHIKLAPLRQRRREFFNLYPDDAIRAIKSILLGQSEVAVIGQQDIAAAMREDELEKPAQSRSSSRRSKEIAFAGLMDSFTELLGIKGRPFGQLNRPVFGISDGREGVQWNLAISPEERTARVGVNLEGMQYDGWPIARFILSELETPTIHELVPDLARPDRIIVGFVRDAWQAASRPPIREAHLAGREIAISEMGVATWKATLVQALGCLNQDRNYQGRSRQEVTLVMGGGSTESKRVMDVSPHLIIWTTINLDDDPVAQLPSAIDRLRPVYRWVSQKSEG